MSTTAVSPAESHYERAIATIEHSLGKLARCTDQEKVLLQRELRQLRDMHHKLTEGRIEIIVFGEISTGKSALINALLGQNLTEVDVRGGWTKDIHTFNWDEAGYRVPGFANSGIVLIDTPGLNEVGGHQRATMARQAAARADLILFVCDADLNQTEHIALTQLVTTDKPVLVVLNKTDLYSRKQQADLMQILRDERLRGIVPPENIVMAAALPRELEVVVESPGGSSRTEWRTPPSDVTAVKARILELLQRDGLALVALNAAMYAADRSDRIAQLRIQFRKSQADRVVWSFASLKALVVALNHLPVLDVLGGSISDVTMVATMARIYGEDLNWIHAQQLVKSILKSAGWVLAGSTSMEWLSSLLKAATFGAATFVTAVPQGAAAGYSSYIVGQAAQFYFENGASWGSEEPKTVVRKILDETDRESIIAQLKEEIQRKIVFNLHRDRRAEDEPETTETYDPRDERPK